MRANSDRSSRLAFDAIAAEYSTGRPDFAPVIVERVVELGGWRAGDRIVEVGAGTGQLTVPLSRQGLFIAAIEPGPRLADALRHRAAGLERVRVVNASFEDVHFDDDPVDGVVAANSFHWLDPATAYRRVAEQLRTDGRLALLWNFPVVADDGIQQFLNDRAWTGPLADLRRDVASDTDELERSLEMGRREMEASARFGEPVWEITSLVEQWPVDRLASFAASLASTTAHRDLIVHRLDELHLDEPIEMLNRVYICSARRR